MKPLFAWVHLSDIHFGHGGAAHAWDQQLVLSCLLSDVSQAGERGVPAPTSVFVTGDIAFSGGTRGRPGQTRCTEYEEATRFLQGLAQRLGLDAASVLVVPGNHDVQRAVDRDKEVRRLVEQLREGKQELDAALAQPPQRALLARRQANFLEWARQFGPATRESPTLGEERLFWTHRLEVAEGLRVRVVGLNTALLSADDSDQGRLRLGNEQLARALLIPPVEPQELVLVLGHHPLEGGWLADERSADAWIRNHAHLHLSGHVHEAGSEQARSGAGGLFVRVVAGAAHGDAAATGVPSGHGYNLAAIYVTDGGQLVLRVWPRRWSDKRKGFVTDQDNVSGHHPYSEHLLRLTLPFRGIDEMLRSEHSAERVRGLIEVALDKNPRYLDRLLGLLRTDGHGEVRAHAALALDELRDLRAKEGLLTALSDPSWDVRSHAGWGLVHLGPVVLDDVRRVAASSDNPDAVQMARLVLARL
ncbi:metallophosphoesterase [Myxococcus stipitatus]|uniref:HEAT repeat domain-containing protein n=1 Tax=Myxococcus stipitatus TaxID=83455 RepID=UPI001F3EB4E4|nr:metallophosphoesterase [Myxococcus stipitatus]MCE9666340.1 metallophosphoesterase [Myxococcus stipitatus]